MAIHKLKSGRYWIDYRDANGDRKRPRFDTWAEADREHKKQIGVAATNKKKERARASSPELRTLRELLDFHYTQAMAHWQEESRRDWLRRGEAFVVWCEAKGVRYAHQVSKKLALAYVTHCLKVRSGKGIESHLIAASAIFKTELEFSEPPCIYRNPFSGIKKGGYTRKKKPQPIEVTQLNAFLSCCPEFEYHLFRIDYAGGFRGGELRNLMWSQLGRKGIQVANATFRAKTEESEGLIRLNKILDESFAWFRKRTGDKRYVIDRGTFVKKSGGWKGKVADRVGETFIWERFNLVKAIAQERYPEFEWEGFTPHKLRASYGTHLAELGVPMIVIQQLMRHKSYSTTVNSYINVSSKHVEDGAKMLDSIPLQKFGEDSLKDTTTKNPRIQYH